MDKGEKEEVMEVLLSKNHDKTRGQRKENKNQPRKKKRPETILQRVLLTGTTHVHTHIHTHTTQRQRERETMAILSLLSCFTSAGCRLKSPPSVYYIRSSLYLNCSRWQERWIMPACLPSRKRGGCSGKSLRLLCLHTAVVSFAQQLSPSIKILSLTASTVHCSLVLSPQFSATSLTLFILFTLALC